jgi:pimeloyl-ACP methyl ester carboxylesterase
MEPNVTFRGIFTNGIELHVAEAGPVDGPLVLLLHGFPEFWYSWRYQIGPLAEAGYHVLAPDLRGYNLSQKPRVLDSYRLDVLAADVVGLIDALDRGTAAVVGHDWGGVVGWVTAVLHPQRVEKFAPLNAPYPPVSARTLPRHPQQLLRSAYMYFFQLPGLPEAVLRNNNWELLARGLMTTSREGTFSEADLDRYRRAWWKKGAMTAMLNWYRALFRRPYPLPWSPRLPMPVLMLWGARDFALGRELAEASMELCDNGRLVFFEGATHWVQHEEAARVNDLLLNFLGAGK